MKNLLRFTFISLLILFLKPYTIKACTVFTAANGDKILAAKNMDWKETDARMLFIPPSQGIYGRVFIGVQVPEGFCNTSGMNDQGLWYAGASLPVRHDIKNHYNKPRIYGELCEKALRECATVAEVIQIYTTYYEPFWNGHGMWADKNGDAVIFEFGEKDVVYIRKQGTYQLMTNFYIVDSTNTRWYSSYRYNIADHMLRNSDDVSLDLFRRIADATHQEGSNPTHLTSIHDLKNGDIYLYNWHNYDEVVRLNLQEELNKGESYYKVSGFFQQIKLNSPTPEEVVIPAAVNFIWMVNTTQYNLCFGLDPDFLDYQTIEVKSSVAQGENSDYIGCLAFSLLIIGFTSRKRKKILSIVFCCCLIFMGLTCESDIITSPFEPSELEHSLTVENLEPDRVYYWKVMSIADNGINSESVPQ